MEFLARVNARYFAGIQLFAAQQDVRYYLNGVSIEPHPEKGAVIVATDGYRLAAIHDPDGMCKEPIIVGEITKGLISACKAKGSLPRMTIPGHLWISRNGALLTNSFAGEQPPVDSFDATVLHASKITLVDGKFPDWRKVIRQRVVARGEPMPSVNAEYIAAVSEACRIMSPTARKRPIIRLTGTGSTGVVIARSHDFDLAERFVAAIMPCRAEDPKTLLPTWMAPKAKPRLKYRGSELVTA